MNDYTQTRSPFKECTPARPCPICQKKSWCAVTLDGTVAHCHKVQSDRATSTGWIHVLTDAPVRPMPTLPPMPSVAHRLFSAQFAWDRLDAAYDRWDIDGLALYLGVQADALERLGARWDANAVRWTQAEDGTYTKRDAPAWAFPMRDGDGKMVGIRLRTMDGDKWAVKHSKEGLFYDATVESAHEVFVCEGPTDAAAVMSLGYVAVGRPSCMGAVEHTKTLLRRWGCRRMVVVADNDTAKLRPDGVPWYPGREGALLLTRAVGMEYKMLMTPTKDIRKWVNEGATRKDIQDVLAVLRWKMPTP